MQIAVAALLENLLPGVDQMDSHVYNEYKWKARIVSLARADVTLRILRAGQVISVTSPSPAGEITRRKMQPKLCKHDANPGAP